MRNLLFFLLLNTMSVWAGIYPVITSITTTITSDGADYALTQKPIDIGPESERVLPSGYHVSIRHKHWTGSTYIASIYSLDTVPMVNTNGVDTIGTLAMQVYEQGGKNFSVLHHKGQNGFQECVAYLAYQGDQNSGNWQTTILPAGCLNTPPADEWCKITTPEILLDHGSVTLKDANGSSVQEQVGVECTSDMAVTFNLITDDTYIYLDDGQSEIYVDDKPLNSKVDLPGGRSQVEVKDLLTGVTKEGFHTGSSVLVMMPY